MSRYLSLFLPVLVILATGFVIGLCHYNSKIKMRPVIILLGVTFLSEILSYFMAKYLGNNMPLAHFFNPLQLTIWAVFFYNNYDVGKMKRAIKWVTIAMLLLALLNSLILQPLNKFPDNFIKLETMLLVIWGAYLFIQQLDMPGKINVFKDPVFIVSVAVLWFNLLSFLFFLLFAYLVKNSLPTESLNTIHYFTNYVYYFLLLVAIALPQQKISYE